MDEALRKAAQAGSVEGIVAAVERGASVNASDDGGDTALTYAMMAEMSPGAATRE